MIFWYLFTLTKSATQATHPACSVLIKLTFDKAISRAIILLVSVLIAVYVISVMCEVTWAGARHPILHWHPAPGADMGPLSSAQETLPQGAETENGKPETQRGGPCAVKTTLKNVLNYGRIVNYFPSLLINTSATTHWKLLKAFIENIFV